MATQQTYINGNRWSFVNVSVTVGGNDIAAGAFKSINYDAMQDSGLVQGNQITIVGRTAGYGTGTGSFEMLVYELDQLLAALSSNGQVPAMSVDFDIVVSYSINDVDVRKDELLGCRIVKVGTSNQTGNDASTKSCDLSIARVKFNGVSAFGDPSQ